MTTGSRIPGFYRLSIPERRRAIAERSGLELEELEATLSNAGLSTTTADKVVENVLGVYGLPLGIALNVVVNSVERLVPMVVEEPSVIAAASNAARMVRETGGFQAELVEDLMIAQVQLFEVADTAAACRHLEEAATDLLAIAERSVPGLVARGGGPRSVEVRDLGHGAVVLHLLVDCVDAMGANLCNTIAEAVGPTAAEITSGTLGLRILSNLCDRRRVRVTCRVRAESLALRSSADPTNDGLAVAQGIEQASRFAELDPYRATTHNKGIMNGVDAVVLATGNDFRAVEAGAHAYAARSGKYRPLATWRAFDDELRGQLELPLALGTVGGTLRVHPIARLALNVMGITEARDLTMTAACAGLASNLAALRALATEGIQRGHMSLHARSVATAAGAAGDEVERVAEQLSLRGEVTLDAAERELRRLRSTAT